MPNLTQPQLDRLLSAITRALVHAEQLTGMIPELRRLEKEYAELAQEEPRLND